MGGGGSMYIPPLGVGATLRTDRGFQRITEIGLGCYFPPRTSIEPVRLEDGTYRLVVCEGMRFWMLVVDSFTDKLVRESLVMPKVDNRAGASSFYVEVVRKYGGPIDIGVSFPDGRERRV